MYWLSKMHKIPSKHRFIVAGSICSLKMLSGHVTSAFQLFFRQIENYNKKLTFLSTVNKFWAVQNNLPIRTAINPGWAGG